MLAIKVEYLCHIVSNNVILVSQQKVQLIREWRKRKDEKDVRFSLDLLNYCHRFIAHFFGIAKQLTEPTKTVQFQWNSITENSFDSRISAFTSAPTLAPIDPKRETTSLVMY